ncbi:MAG: GntR family transcriptional regulator, partial [Methylotenera sp.]|nr:GntR family transcriptional regulator [Methylotenera sp.]
MLRSWSLNLNIKNTSGLAVYLQIAQQVVDEIQRGRLAPSTAMPGTRDLAEKLKVNRKTVVLAYDELIAQGWLTTESRRGTFVSANLPNFNPQPKPNKLTTKAQPPNATPTTPSYHTPSPNSIDFNDGIPDTRLIPFEILSRAFRHVLLATAKNSRLGYGDPKGVHDLRLAIATMLNMERGLNVDVDHICIA